MSLKNLKTDLPLANCFSETPKKVTKFKHLWTIENFRFHPKDKIIESPLFSAAPNEGVQWQLRLYPNGDGENNRGFISVFLYLVSCEAEEASARFRISILNGNHEPKATKHTADPDIFKLKTGNWGYNRLMKRSDVLISTKFPGDVLIVSTEITYAAEVSPKVQSLTSFFPPGMPEHNPSADFRELLESGMFFDVVFDVNGREFRAHKAILATRSPTFKTLFERNSEGTRATRFGIRDADDHTFFELLNLVYTGKTKESHPQIQKLLSAIAVQGQAASTTDSSDSNRTEGTKVPDDTNSRKTNGSLSSKLKNTASGGNTTVSVLESIKALIASNDTLRLDSSTEKSNLECDSSKFACRTHPEIKLTPSAALVAIGAIISATTLHSQLEESSTLESPKETSIKTMEVADKPLSKKTDLTLPPDCTDDLGDNQLQGSSIGGEERVLSRTPLDVVKKFNGDKTKFLEWWRGFKAQVHGRGDLCIVQKLIKLLSSLEGEAEECINNSALDLFEVMSYYATLDSLFLRYANIDALPPGMFALLMVRRRNRLTLPLRIVDNRILMERIENIHRVSDVLESSKSDKVEHKGKPTDSVSAMVSSKDPGEDGVLPYPESGCRCQAYNLSCAAAIEKQLEGLERLFAETRSPASLALQNLAKKIGLTETRIQMWLRLRPVDWNKALHPHWQLEEVDALSGCKIQTETIDSDGSDFEVL